MRRRRPRVLSALVVAGLTGLTLLTGGSALADEAQTTVDVLKVVDGEYVVETLTVAAPTAEQAADDLEDDAGVLVASPSVTYELEAVTDPLWEADDPQATSGAPTAWARTRGEGQVVAVLDTAASIVHPDLAGAVLEGIDATDGTAGDPWHGHGVAGVIAARADNGLGSAGMAPAARILPVRVCVVTCTSADVARGILGAVDRGADVLNLSLSGPGWSDVTAAAIQYALSRNVSVVASAGNSGDEGNAVHYPAANSGVIAVASNGPTGIPTPWAQHGWQVDLSTVGESVVMTMPGGGYALASGTSFSGPAVAGAVALLRAANPGIPVEDVQAALQAGADSSSWDRAWGAGRLDLPAALAAADRLDGGVTVTSRAQGVDVAWAAVPGATGYTVRVDGVVRATVATTSATVTGLVDGNQVAVDVQPSNGARSKPVLATVGATVPGTPVLHSAGLRGTSGSATLDLSVSVTGSGGNRLTVLRDGISVGTYAVSLSGTPQTFSILIGAMPVHETRWQVQFLDSYGRLSPLSNSVTTGSTRPAPPAALTGLAGLVDGDDVLLTWTGLGDAYTYRVSEGGQVVGTSRTAASAVPGPAAASSRTYEVVAVDAWGQTGPPVAVTVARGTTPSAIVAPAVTGTAQVGRTVTSSAVFSDADTVAQTWRACDPGGCAVVGTGDTHVVTTAAQGKRLEVTAVATNANGSTTVISARSAVVLPAATIPGAPTIGTPTPGNGQVLVRWSPPASDGYSPITAYYVETYRNGTFQSGRSLPSGATSHTVTGLANGIPYTFRVSAYNAKGWSPASAHSAPVTPRTLPGPPAIGAVSAGDGQATVRWSPPAFNGGAPVTGYTVRTYRGATLVRSDGAAAGATSRVVPGLRNGVGYTFTVVARNAAGTGAASARSAAVIPRVVPPAAPELAIVHQFGVGMNLWSVPLSDRATDYGRPGLVSTLNYGGFSYAGSRTLSGNFGNVSGVDDGTPDHVIWHAQPNGGVLVWAVGGGADTRPKLWRDLRTGGWAWAASSPLVGDVNGDGWDDLVVQHANGPSSANVWVLLSDGRTLGAPQLWGRTGLGLRALMADVDGDGRDDLIVARSYDTGLRYEVFRVVGSAFAPAPTAVFTGSPAGGWSYAASRQLAGDVTGDGLPDVVTLHAQGGNPGLLVWVHRNCTVPGGPICFAPPQIWQDLRTGGWAYAGSRQYLADSNGDGVLDLVSVHSQTGNPGVLVWRHLSTTTRLASPQIVSDLRTGGWQYTASRASVS